MENNYNAGVQAADAAMAEKEQEVYKSVHRPNYHIYSQSGWINDPNGLVKFKDEYHVFYQLHPYSAEWGPMHWGHVISKDLVHWRRAKVALAPDTSYETGCFSGNAVDNDGKLTLVYTSHDDRRTVKEYQCIAESQDGESFVKRKEPVVAAPPEECDYDFRDPKAWKHNGLWYLIVGGGKDGIGKLPLYTSKDFIDWDYRGVLLSSEGQGSMWECPNYVKIDGQDVLMVSPMNMEGHKNIFIYGNLDYDKLTFNQTGYSEADYGHDFYAAQFLNDGQRAIMIGWLEMWGNEMPTAKEGWAGILSFPRELKMKDGCVVQAPVKEIELLYENTLVQSKSFVVEKNSGDNLKEIKGRALDISLEIRPQEGTQSFWLELCKSEDGDEKTLVSFDLAKGKIILDRRLSGLGAKKVDEYDFELGAEVSIRVLVDNSSLEIFVDGKAISARIYPTAQSVSHDLMTDGRLQVRCSAYTLKNIW